jgi:hypothetical protein
VFLAHGSVAHVHSAIALDRLKKTARLPLTHLRAAAEEQEPQAHRGKKRSRGVARKPAPKTGTPGANRNSV